MSSAITIDHRYSRSGLELYRKTDLKRFGLFECRLVAADRIGNLKANVIIEFKIDASDEQIAGWCLVDIEEGVKFVVDKEIDPFSKFGQVAGEIERETSVDFGIGSEESVGRIVEIAALDCLAALDADPRSPIEFQRLEPLRQWVIGVRSWNAHADAQSKCVNSQGTVDDNLLRSKITFCVDFGV